MPRLIDAMFVIDYKRAMARKKKPGIGESIARLMERYGLEPKDVYKAMGCSQQTVWTWIKGKYTPQLVYLPKLEDVVARLTGKKVTRGTILIDAGYVASLREQLANCDDIADFLKPYVLQTFDSAVSQTKEMEGEALTSLPSTDKISRAS
jgi:transcriptional regulator with XRE-family HTH domain